MTKKDNYEIATTAVPDFIRYPDGGNGKPVDDTLKLLLMKIMEERNHGISDWARGLERYYNDVVTDMPRSKKVSDKSNLKDALNKDRLSFANFIKSLVILSCASEDSITIEICAKFINHDNPEDSTIHEITLPQVNKPPRRTKRSKRQK